MSLSRAGKTCPRPAERALLLSSGCYARVSRSVQGPGRPERPVRGAGGWQRRRGGRSDGTHRPSGVHCGDEAPRAQRGRRAARSCPAGREKPAAPPSSRPRPSACSRAGVGPEPVPARSRNWGDSLPAPGAGIPSVSFLPAMEGLGHPYRPPECGSAR